MARHGARRVGRLGAQLFRRVPGPARVPHRAAADADEVGFARGDDVFGLLRPGDEADRHGRQAGRLAHGFGERRVVAGRERDLLPRIDLAGRHVHVVAAKRLELVRERNRVLDGGAAVDPIDCRDADAHRLVGGPRLAHRLEHFERVAHPLLHAAAIFVRALVGERRQELVDQVAVAAVHLDDVVADALGALHGRNVILDQVLHLALGQRVRRMPALAERDRRRRDGLPGVFFLGQRLGAERRRLGRALAPGVTDLQTLLGDAVLLAEVDDAFHRLLVVVGIETGAFVRDAADRIDVGHFGHDQRRCAERELAEVHQMPVIGGAVGRVVLAHGRDNDAVGQRQAAHGDRREQRAGHLQVSPLESRSACAAHSNRTSRRARLEAAAGEPARGVVIDGGERRPVEAGQIALHLVARLAL